MPIGFHPIELLTFLFSIFWIWMLVDCLINQRLKGGAKVGWFLLIFFLHWFGALIYFFVGRGR
ncbi:MAG TPA: PLD nuclease N-terminal domain-containing protein, partial [Ktedonosporobacter sp.]|nr:PLD nuclease N-terminal domain-containing protein [Ktedonosporobacter sp.]